MKDELEKKINFKNFWYIACESKELKINEVLPRTILDEWIAIFRGSDGKPVALLDRCIHRNSQLSKGWVKNGQLQCSYHGWTFNKEGKLTSIPSEGPNKEKVGSRCAKKFECMEQDGLIYVRLEKNPDIDIPPHKMPHYGEKGWQTVRLFNIFKNSVINCAENYIDVPHTVFVHDKIFRDALDEKVTTKVQRKDGAVHIEYIGETDNLGWFSWFLNPKKVPITHIDHYYMPNITSVQYVFGKKEFWITSQCIPINEELTWVWTDLTYKFGPIGVLARPIVAFQGQKVIEQDIIALDNQMEVIKKYGEGFSNATADVVHVMIESIYNAIKAGKDPRELAEKNNEVVFWI